MHRPVYRSVRFRCLRCTLATVLASTASAHAASPVQIIAGDGEAEDRFGAEVAVSGDTVIVGAPEDDDLASNSGAAYIYRWDGAGWVFVAKLTASDGDEEDQFGQALAIDGDVAVVGVAGSGGVGAAYVFRRSEPGFWTEEQKLTASDAALDASFGSSVAVSGDTMIVGANSDNEVASFGGAAYVFVHDGVSWVEQQKITASDGAENDGFGGAACIDGDSVAIAARGWDDPMTAGQNHGAVYVFTRSGTVWTEQQQITASDPAGQDLFGTAICLDGDSLIVGAPYKDEASADAGAAYVFTRTAGVWSEEQKLVPDDGALNDYFGFAVAIAGDTALAGAPFLNGPGSNSGATYVFTRAGDEWLQEDNLVMPGNAGGDNFGGAVALDADRAVVGAYGDDFFFVDQGSVFNFERVGVLWVGSEQKVVAALPGSNDNFGVAVDVEGDTAIVGIAAENTVSSSGGAAAVYTNVGGTWTETQTLFGSAPSANQSTEYFGISVALDGDTAIVGASQTGDSIGGGGAVYVFTRAGGVWSELQALTASDAAVDDWFGYSVDIDGDYLIVGSRLSDGAAGSAQGAAYIFKRNGGIWSQQQKLLPSDPGEFDQFGFEVAISGGTVMVGSPGDNDSGDDSGSVYEFTFDGLSWTESQKLTASDAATEDQFGYAISIQNDMMLVGANLSDDGGSDRGSVYVFERVSNVWGETQKILEPFGADNAAFGSGVDLDGNRAVMSAPVSYGRDSQTGGAYVYRRSGAQWAPEARLAGSDSGSFDYFGQSVAIHGDNVLVGAFFDDVSFLPDAGSAYFFRRTPDFNTGTTVRNYSDDTSEPTYLSAVTNALSGESLAAEYASFQTSDTIDYAGKAIDTGSVGEIRQPFSAFWTFADGARLYAPVGARIDLFGSITIPAGATTTMTSDVVRFGAASTLTGGAGSVLSIEGDLDIAISNPARFTFDEGEVVVSGNVSAAIEALSADIGGGGGARVANPFALGTLRILSGGSAEIVDNHDNDSSTAGAEALYVSDLIIQSAASLTTNGRRIYYETLSNDGSIDDPANLIDLTPCPADITGDNTVDGADLAALLAQWGTNGSADLTGDGNVDGADLAALLAAWGVCP